MRRARFIAGTSTLAFHAASLALDFVLPDRSPELFEARGAVAIVTVKGPTVQHHDWCWDSYDAIRQRVGAAMASSASTVLLKIASPGGEVPGLFELVREIRGKAAAAGKRVVAYVDGQAVSAGYALACAASEVYVPESAEVGSIGILKVSIDVSAIDRAQGVGWSVIASGARKADGHPHVPMTDDARAAIQRDVDAIAQVFVGLVAEARGVPAAKIAGLEAGTLIGAAAVAAGLADTVTTFDGLLAMLATGSAANAPRGAEVRMAAREDAIAALVEMAKGDDGEEKDEAIGALSAMGLDADGKAKSEETSEEAKRAEDSDEEKPKAEDEKGKEEAKASAASSAPLALAAKVLSLEAKLAAREQAEERQKLMASRPDFTPEIVAFLEKQPVATVRDAVKSLPKGPAKTNAVANARAATSVQATRAEGQTDDGARSSDEVRTMLDVQMGIAPPATAIRHEGTRLFMGVMTPEQSRAERERRAAVARAQTGGAK